MGSMNDLFQVTGCSIVGSDHRFTWDRNRQDACGFGVGKSVAIGVVCDGCGEAENSEIGAQMGARILLHAVHHHSRMIRDFSPEIVEEFLELVRGTLLRKIRLIVSTMGGKDVEVLAQYFLFTALGFVVTKNGALVFGCGDGVYAINGETTILTSLKNHPAYIAYGINPQVFRWPEEPKFTAYHVVSCEEVENIIIGSDGLARFVAAELATVRETGEGVGPLSQFATQDRYFQNPDMIRRKLETIGDGTLVFPDGRTRREWLNDDTTMVSVRRI